MELKSVVEHFEDLRFVFLRCVLVYIFFFCLSYFAFPIWENASVQLIPNLIYLRVYEPILLKLSVMTWISIIAVFPYIAIEIFSYLRDVIKINLLIFILAIGLYSLSICFAWNVILPKFCDILLAFSTENIKFYIGALNFSQFAGSVIFVSALILSLPMFLMALGLHKLVNIDLLLKNRIYVFPLSFVFSAFITPPDIISQIAVGCILYLVFELFILLNRLSSSS